MTVQEAKDIFNKYGRKSVLTDDEEFVLLEAIKYLVEETGSTKWMIELGGYYYEQKKFDLALKYYELADTYGDKWAPEGLGYIWYYGRTGVKDFLIQRIMHNPFFGDLNSMKWLTEDLYDIVRFDRSDFDLYDLYVLLKEPVKVAFGYYGDEHTVESVKEEGGMAIKFDGKWYRDIDDFFLKATLDGERIPCLYNELTGFRVI